MWELSHETDRLRAFKVLVSAERRDPPDEFPVARGPRWLYVLSGRLRLILGERDEIIEPGEAVEFSTWAPHWFGAVDGDVELIAIFGPQGERIRPPRFDGFSRWARENPSNARPGGVLALRGPRRWRVSSAFAAQPLAQVSVPRPGGSSAHARSARGCSHQRVLTCELQVTTRRREVLEAIKDAVQKVAADVGPAVVGLRRLGDRDRQGPGAHRRPRAQRRRSERHVQRRADREGDRRRRRRGPRRGDPHRGHPGDRAGAMGRWRSSARPSSRSPTPAVTDCGPRSAPSARPVGPSGVREGAGSVARSSTPLRCREAPPAARWSTLTGTCWGSTPSGARVG